MTSGLSDEEYRRFTRFVNRRWRNKACLRCGQNDWSVEGLVAQDIHSIDEDSLPDAELPSVVMVCQNCGSTEFVNAVVAGVVEDEL